MKKIRLPREIFRGDISGWAFKQMRRYGFRKSVKPETIYPTPAPVTTFCKGDSREPVKITKTIPFGISVAENFFSPISAGNIEAACKRGNINTIIMKSDGISLEYPTSGLIVYLIKSAVDIAHQYNVTIHGNNSVLNGILVTDMAHEEYLTGLRFKLKSTLYAFPTINR